MSDRLALAYVDVRADTRRLKGDFNKVEDTAKQSMGRVTDIIAAAGGAAAGMSLIRWGSRLAGEAETAATAINVIVKDAEKTKALIAEVNEFSTRTPFTPKDLKKATQAMLAFQVQTEDIGDRLQTLGDISAGSNSRLGEVVAVFNKIKATGKLTGETYLQLAERGINVKDVLMDMLGTTGDEYQTMQRKGEISFEMVLKAMEKMTVKGGMFFEAMQQQSGTWAGKLSTLEGNIGLIGEAFGEHLIEKGKFVVDIFNKILVGIIELDQATGGAVTQTAAYTTALVTMTAAAWAANAAMKALGISIRGVMKATVILAVIATTIGLIVSAANVMKKAFDGTTEIAEEWAPVIDNLRATWILFKDAALAVWEAIKSAGNSAMEGLTSMFGDWFNFSIDSWADLASWITDQLLNIATGLKVLATRSDLVWAVIKAKAILSWRQIGDFVSGTFKLIFNGAWALVKSIGNAFSLIPKLISELFTKQDIRGVVGEAMAAASAEFAIAFEKSFKPSAETKAASMEYVKAQAALGAEFNRSKEDAKSKAREIREEQEKMRKEKEKEKALDGEAKGPPEVKKSELKLSLEGFDQLNKTFQDMIFKQENPNAKLEQINNDQLFQLKDLNENLKNQKNNAAPVADN